MISSVFSIGLMLAAVFAFVAATMMVTHLLGPKRHSQHKDESFECGIPSVGNARTRFSFHYFSMAILFVLFDVEIIFFYPWAVNFRVLGTIGFIEMSLFMGGICVGFFYLMQNRILDFGAISDRSHPIQGSTS